MIRHPQWAHCGASLWIAHSKLSKAYSWSLYRILSGLSYSLPHVSHLAIAISSREAPANEMPGGIG